MAILSRIYLYDVRECCVDEDVLLAGSTQTTAVRKRRVHRSMSFFILMLLIKGSIFPQFGYPMYRQYMNVHKTTVAQERATNAERDLS